MLKSKVYKTDPTKANLVDFIFGINNAWKLWEITTPIHMICEWNGKHKEYNFDGSQAVDFFMGLIEEFHWQESMEPIKVELSWNDGQPEPKRESGDIEHTLRSDTK